MICGVIGEPVGGGVALAVLPPSRAAPTATAAISARPYHFDFMNLPFGSVQGSPRRPECPPRREPGTAHECAAPERSWGAAPLERWCASSESEREVPRVEVAGVDGVDVLHLELPGAV